MTSRGGGSASAETFAEMARALLAEADVQQTLQKIVDMAVETIDGCDYAGISFLKGRKVDTPIEVTVPSSRSRISARQVST